MAPQESLPMQGCSKEQGVEMRRDVANRSLNGRTDGRHTLSARRTGEELLGRSLSIGTGEVGVYSRLLNQTLAQAWTLQGENCFFGRSELVGKSGELHCS